MNSITSQQYTGYNPYIINNNLLSSNIKQDTQVQKEQAIESTNNTIPEINRENKELSKQEITAIYFNREATQLTKALMDTYTGVESSEDEVTLKDINEFHRKSNRNEVVQNYDDQNTNISELIDTFNPQKQVTSEEAISIYLTHKENDLTENKIDIYANTEEDETANEISAQNVNDIYEKNNRNDFLQNFNLNDNKLYA